jgi:hypothetical protein
MLALLRRLKSNPRALRADDDVRLHDLFATVANSPISTLGSGNVVEISVGVVAARQQACSLTVAFEQFQGCKAFSRCCSRLMGRMIVVSANENDLDYLRSMRFCLCANKLEQRPHI